MAVSPQESKYSAHVSPDKPLRIVRLGGGLGNQMFNMPSDWLPAMFCGTIPAF